MPTKTIPYEKGLPFLGKTLSYQKDCFSFYKHMYAKYGEVSCASMFFGDVYFLLGADANEFVLLNKDKHFSSKEAWSLFLEKLFPGGLMLRDGKDHKYHRRLMNAAFSGAALKSYQMSMQRRIPELLGAWQAEQNIDFYPSIKALTLELAADVFMGIQDHDEIRNVNACFEQVVAASLAIVKTPLPFSKHRKGVRARAKLDAFFLQLLPLKRQKDDSDMFSFLAHARDENGKAFSDSEIINHMVFLMMAAHDTTTSALSSIAEALVEHPQWQDALRQEIDSLNAQVLLPEHLDKMPLCAMVLKEALRMYPPLPSIPRMTSKEISYKGHTIPANSLVDISPLLTHHMAELWESPEAFNPYRFEASADNNRHRYAWIPFGGGVHKCLGLHFAEMQVKVILFHLLKQYKLEATVRKTKEKILIPIIKPKDGLPISLGSGA